MLLMPYFFIICSLRIIKNVEKIIIFTFINFRKFLQLVGGPIRNATNKVTNPVTGRLHIGTNTCLFLLLHTLSSKVEESQCVQRRRTVNV